LKEYGYLLKAVCMCRGRGRGIVNEFYYIIADRLVSLNSLIYTAHYSVYSLTWRQDIVLFGQVNARSSITCVENTVLTCNPY